jgi:NAD(P)-dependent dehydrogenase (short-subunit alcohol dehydrogenase family)
MADTSMKGKTVLVTGASGGIGLVTAAELARMGASVTMVARDRAKGEAALAEAKQRSGSDDIEILYADLASLAAVRALAKNFMATHDALHVLVNNAGAMHAQRAETADGFEMTIGVNHLAHFLLTELLLDILKSSGRAGSAARIVNVSSHGHYGGWIVFDDLQLKRLYIPMFAYAQSKLANVLHAYELTHRLEGTNVTANALHPGLVSTNFGKNNGGAMESLVSMAQTVTPWMFITPERGAETSIHLASSPEVEGVSGRYFDGKRSVPSSFVSYDRRTQSRLWDASAELVGLEAGAKAVS